MTHLPFRSCVPKRLGLGIAGLGRIATRFHMPTLLRTHGVSVRAIADTDAKAQECARRNFPTARILSSWEALVDDRSIDAIVNCLPTELHASSASAFLSAGKALYLEKPLANTLGAAIDVARLWAVTGTPCQIGFNFRFHPSVLEARARIAAGQIGSPLATVSTLSNPPRDRKRLSTVFPILLLHDLAVHHIDLVRFLLNDEFAAVTSGRVPSMEHSVVQFEALTVGGVCVQISTANTETQLDSLTIIGRSGTIILDRFLSNWSIFGRRSNWRTGRALVAFKLAQQSLLVATRAMSRTPDISYARALRVFIDHLHTNRTLAPDVIDGLRATEVVDAAERVFESGRRREVTRVAIGIRAT